MSAEETIHHHVVIGITAFKLVAIGAFVDVALFVVWEWSFHLVHHRRHAPHSITSPVRQMMKLTTRHDGHAIL
jgi:hypothetical protein